MGITQKRLKSLLSYSPETGEFVWLVNQGRARAGMRAGTILSGYVVIKIDGIPYKGHRLAWLFMKGKLPRGRLDHRDGECANNRWGNLRRASHSQNMANRKLNKNNSTGFKGVSGSPGKYLAYVNKNGKRSYLGTFVSPELAFAARQIEANKLHGEFARAK